MTMYSSSLERSKKCTSGRQLTGCSSCSLSFARLYWKSPKALATARFPFLWFPIIHSRIFYKPESSHILFSFARCLSELTLAVIFNKILSWKSRALNAPVSNFQPSVSDSFRLAFIIWLRRVNAGHLIYKIMSEWFPRAIPRDLSNQKTRLMT